MTRSPGGASAPTAIRTQDGRLIDLIPVANEICRRYHLEFSDEADRYGEAGRDWCRHDNCYLLAWAIQEARDGTVSLAEQVAWLANVLDKRGFPVERLARDLAIARDVAGETTELGGLSSRVSDLLGAAAADVSARDALPIGRGRQELS